MKLFETFPPDDATCEMRKCSASDETKRKKWKKAGLKQNHMGLRGFTLSSDYLSDYLIRISLQDFHGWHTLPRLKECVSNRVIRPQRNSSTLTCWFQISVFERFKKQPRQIIPAHSCRWVAHGGEPTPFASAGFQFKIQVEARAADYQDQARHLANRPTITSVLSM